MADRCAFEFDVSADHRGPRKQEGLFEDLPTTEGQIWRCPRIQSDDEEYCRVHSPETTDEEVQQIIRDSLRETDLDSFSFYPEQKPEHESTRFLGVELQRLDLSGRVFSGEMGTELDLRGAKIDELILSGAKLPFGCRMDGSHIGSISMTGAVVDGAVLFRNADIQGPVHMRNLRSDGAVKLRYSDVSADVSAVRVQVAGRLDFGFTEIDGSITVEKSECRGRFTLKEADLNHVNARNLIVDGFDSESNISGLQFRGLTVHGSLDIRDCMVEGTLIGHDLTVHGTVEGSGISIQDDIILGTRDSSTSLPNPELYGSVDFSQSEIGGELRLAGDGHSRDPVVGGPLWLTEAEIGTAKLAPSIDTELLQTVDLQRADIETGFLGQPAGDHDTYYDLTETTLGTVDLASDGSPMDRFWIDRTNFERFRFELNRSKFLEINWRLDRPSEDLRRSVAISRSYRTARELAIDWLVALSELPSLRMQVLADTPPELVSCAEWAFEDLSRAEITRLAQNGPESETVLGEAIFERERYREGVITYLAREMTGMETVLSPLYKEASPELETLARTVVESDGQIPQTHEDVRVLAMAFASTMADQQSIEPDLDQQQTTYIKARKGADDVGDSIAVANFFVRELRVRRKEHASLARNAETARRRIQAARDYTWNLLFDAVAGYGERPRNVVGASVLLISIFSALFYYLHGTLDAFDSETYGGIDGAVLLSLESFTSLVLGGTSVDPWLVRLLANALGFAGAFLIALFVFTLTRSLNR